MRREWVNLPDLTVLRRFAGFPPVGCLTASVTILYDTSGREAYRVESLFFIQGEAARRSCAGLEGCYGAAGIFFRPGLFPRGDDSGMREAGADASLFGIPLLSDAS